MDLILRIKEVKVMQAYLPSIESAKLLNEHLLCLMQNVGHIAANYGVIVAVGLLKVFYLLLIGLQMIFLINSTYRLVLLLRNKKHMRRFHHHRRTIENRYQKIINWGFFIE